MRRDTTSDPDIARLAEDLRRAVGTFVRAIRQTPDGAKSAQAETLDLLDRDGAMNVARLADARNVKHQTMRLVVAQLQKAAFVERAPDPADGRSQLFSISPSGKAELTRARNSRASRIENAIRDALPIDDQRDLRGAIGLLERLAKSANEGEAIPSPKS